MPRIPHVLFSARPQVITHATVLTTGGQLLPNRNITIKDDGSIGDIFQEGRQAQNEMLADYDNRDVIDADGAIVSAGLIEQHFHGGYTIDFNTASKEEILALLQELPKQGITRVIPTIMTDTTENLVKAANTLRETMAVTQESSFHGAKIEGFSLEGPFISENQRGAHPKDIILQAVSQLPQNVDNLLNSLGRENSQYLKWITIAPEKFGSTPEDIQKVITGLTQKYPHIRFHMGHSAATVPETQAAVAAGVNGVTHMFNQCGAPLSHRDEECKNPNPLLLANTAISKELIADNAHIEPAVLFYHFNQKIGQQSWGSANPFYLKDFTLVSDSSPLTGCEKGTTLEFGGHVAEHVGHLAANKDMYRQDPNQRGIIVGSVRFIGECLLHLHKALKNLMPQDPAYNLYRFLLPMATENPARHLNLDKVGVLKQGNKADIVIWDKNALKPNAVWVEGERIMPGVEYKK